jgi:hypothetical protein
MKSTITKIKESNDKIVFPLFPCLLIMMGILDVKWESTVKNYTDLICETEKKLDAENIYITTLSGTHQITNNLLNQLKMVEMEIKRT